MSELWQSLNLDREGLRTLYGGAVLSFIFALLLFSLDCIENTTTHHARALPTVFQAVFP